MGSCVQKPRSKSIKPVPPSFRQHYSSIIMTTEEYQKLYPSDEIRTSRTLNLPPSERPSHLLREKVLLTGKISASKEYGFQDKDMSISSSILAPDNLTELGIAVVCKKGLKVNTPNQDDYFIAIDPHCLVFGVFDGHGPLGHEISNFVQSTLPQLLLSNGNLHDSPQAALVQAFEQCSQQLLNRENCKIDCTISGTTATILCVVDKKVYVAHVGDSRAVVVRNCFGKMTAEAITVDHRPDLFGEGERIRLAGGEIRKASEGASSRVFRLGQNDPGINMSRSLGDTVSRNIGIVSDPDIDCKDIQQTDELFIICSDGVWEFITLEQIADITEKCKGDVKKIAQRISTLAWIQWKKQVIDYVDDITVLIFSPNNQNAKELFYFL